MIWGVHSALVPERLPGLLGTWNNLLGQAAFRRKHLDEAVDFHQFMTDADAVDIWMLDTLRVVSSEDVGCDEANVQSLLKEHKEVTDKLKNYASSFEALREQAQALGEQDYQSSLVVERLASLGHRHKELLEIAELRQQRLLDALPLYKRPSESDGVEQWIGEKANQMPPPSYRDVVGRDVVERPSPGVEDRMEGSLVRKHEWETTTKKASNRSWDKIFVVMHGHLLSFYKNQKSSKAAPNAYFKGENPVDLRGGSAVVATDYTKKKHVFRVKLATGAQYLFQARNDEEMTAWVSHVQAQCDQQGSAGPSRSQTLPAAGDHKE